MNGVCRLALSLFHWPYCSGTFDGRVGSARKDLNPEGRSARVLRDWPAGHMLRFPCVLANPGVPLWDQVRFTYLPTYQRLMRNLYLSRDRRGPEYIAWSRPTQLFETILEHRLIPVRSVALIFRTRIGTGAYSANHVYARLAFAEQCGGVHRGCFRRAVGTGQ